MYLRAESYPGYGSSAQRRRYLQERTVCRYCRSYRLVSGATQNYTELNKQDTNAAVPNAFKCTYIGDPLAGLAFALIGAQPVSPERTADAVLQAVRAARIDSDLLIIETDYALLIDTELQAIVIAEPVPPVVTVPRLTLDERLADASVQEARAVLGIG